MADILIRGCNDHLLNVLKKNTNCEVLMLPPHGDLISKAETMNAILGEPPEAHYPSWYASIVNEIPAIVPSNKEESE